MNRGCGVGALREGHAELVLVQDLGLRVRWIDLSRIRLNLILRARIGKLLLQYVVDLLPLRMSIVLIVILILILIMMWCLLVPLAYGERGRALLVLGEDDPLVLVQFRQLPCQLLLQGEGFDVEFKNFMLIAINCFRKLDEILHLLDVALEIVCALRPEMRTRSLKGRGLVEDPSESRLNECFVTQSLVADSLSEELVEVKVVLHQELHARHVKLHDLLVHHH